MPPGGRGTPEAAPAPGPENAPLQPEAAPPAPPPKVLKPPKPQPTEKKGLPAPDARKAKPKPKKSEEPQTAYDPAKDPTPRRAQAPAGGGQPGATGTGTPGLAFGPPGPGVPGGTDWLGDWYLAGVQRKIWMLWQQQIRSGFSQEIAVRFTILADGSISDVEIVKSSGAALLDLAAQRAVFSAAPFGPLPRNYGTNRFTIQAVFTPTGP
jgi:protein TonB